VLAYLWGLSKLPQAWVLFGLAGSTWLVDAQQLDVVFA
jgi:hypothetical protein